ncbi:hypothetical protein PBY51_010684 [Eleginops maclovinus]|uniref:Uncharacterized protein n=1 Tax=Eleginops maclovinus TaxID=56733 RepID=A0AAN7XB61_ELEMC|nr:hypothetical protein PBY51_010684 [Eleginops maclovinus]
MSGGEVFNKVILTDFLEVNRQEQRRWLRNDEGCALDWTPFLQHVCNLEGRQPSAWTEKAARLRSVVSDVLFVDVPRPHPLDPGALPPAGVDCLVSCFCLEASSPDLAAFTRAWDTSRGSCELVATFFSSEPWMRITIYAGLG